MLGEGVRIVVILRRFCRFRFHKVMGEKRFCGLHPPRGSGSSQGRRPLGSIEFPYPGPLKNLLSRSKSRIRDSPGTDFWKFLKLSGMLRDGVKVVVILGRPCRFRFDKVMGEKRFSVSSVI